MSLEACRQQLALTLARLEREEIIDFNGHFSARLPDGRGLMINAADSVRSRTGARDFSTSILTDAVLRAIAPFRWSFTCTPARVGQRC